MTSDLLTPVPAPPRCPEPGRPLRARRRSDRTRPQPTARAAPDWAGPLLSAVPFGALAVDPVGIVTAVNDAALRLCDEPNEAVGRHWTDVLTLAEDGETDPVRRTLGTGEPVHHRVTDVIDAHGRRIPVTLDTALLRDPDGTVRGCALTLRDLTQAPGHATAHSGHGFEGLIGGSAAMRRVFDRLPLFAQSDSTVLIEGASGTGKELIARALHRLSPRRRGKFVALNCGALPDTLLESELFGYKRGAFTDARRDKPGRFAAAEGGTLFLDEIGDISPAMQVRLLRVLQERVYEPLGSVTPIKTDVRIVVATHHDLHDQVRKGLFRDDLLYRIDVVRLELPALRDRREDIPLLAEHFIRHFNRTQQKDVVGVSADAMRMLLTHDYPGNVRELENIIEHAFVLTGQGLIEPEHLPPWLGPRRAEPDTPTTGPMPTAGMTLAQLEDWAIDEALRRHDGCRRAAADELGINPSTLFRRLRARRRETQM